MSQHTATWQATTEIYDGDGRERTVWRLVTPTGQVVETTRHWHQVRTLTAAYQQQGWTIEPLD